jgi:hypothetical protein
MLAFIHSSFLLASDIVVLHQASAELSDSEKQRIKAQRCNDAEKAFRMATFWLKTSQREKRRKPAKFMVHLLSTPRSPISDVIKKLIFVEMLPEKARNVDHGALPELLENMMQSVRAETRFC